MGTYVDFYLDVQAASATTTPADEYYYDYGQVDEDYMSLGRALVVVDSAAVYIIVVALASRLA